MPSVIRAFTLFLLINTLSFSAMAASRIWPGPAPCNTSLQGCIDASAAGDTVQVAIAGPIDESLLINKSLVLRAAAGHRPRFAANRSIVSQFNAYNLTIDGFEFLDGGIDLTVNGSVQLDVRNNRLLASGGGAGSHIRVHKPSVNNQLDVTLYNNWVEHSAIAADDSIINITSSARTEAKLMFNRIIGASQGEGSGIRLDVGPSYASDSSVFANRVEGRFDAGAIRLTSQEALSAGGTANQSMRAISNAVVCPGGALQGFPVGIVFEPYFASGYELVIANNSVVGCGGDAIAVNAAVTGADVGGSIFNNLVAFNRYAMVVSGNYVDDFSIYRNLVHGNVFSALPPSASDTITADPLLQSPRSPRLTAGSPAINAGNAVAIQLAYAAAGLPQVDADGRRRTIGSGANAVDIGAFEFGDRVSLAQKTTPVSSNSMSLDYPSTPGLRPQIRQVFNPDPDQPGVNNPNPVGVFDLSGWFGYAIGAQMPAGAWLNVFVPGPQGAFNANYLHTTSSGNNSLSETLLSNSFLNSRRPSEAVVLATPVWLGGNQNPSHTAVGYGCDPTASPGANCWRIINQDLANMPTGFGFHIYAQDPSPNAFVHRVTQGGSNVTRFVKHHILGQDPHYCARPVVSQRLGSVNSGGFDLTHDGQQTWSLYNYAGNLAAGSEFDVFVDARAFEECVGRSTQLLFADRFEQG